MAFHDSERIHVDLVVESSSVMRFEFENVQTFFLIGGANVAEYKYKFLGQLYSLLTSFSRDVLYNEKAHGRIRAHISKEVQIELEKTEGEERDIVDLLIKISVRDEKGRMRMSGVVGYDFEEFNCLLEKVGGMYTEAHQSIKIEGQVVERKWKAKMEGHTAEDISELDRFKKKE